MRNDNENKETKDSAENADKTTIFQVTGNQTPNAAGLDFLNDARCRVGDSIVEIAYRPTFGDWLLWLERDEHLMMKEAGNPQNAAWVKLLLSRWREAGRPCPLEWPETRNLHWLRPARSSWPENLNQL